MPLGFAFYSADWKPVDNHYIIDSGLKVKSADYQPLEQLRNLASGR